MDKNLQKAVASSRPVDNLRLLMMSHIEGASGTSQLLYEQLIASEMEKLGIQPRDFFQTLIQILTEIRKTFPSNSCETCYQRTVAAQTPSLWAGTPTSRQSGTGNGANLTGGAVSEPNESRAFREIQNVPKPEPITPLDRTRSSHRLAIKRQRRVDQARESDEYAQELTGFNPNVTIRRWKPTKTRPVAKVKKEHRTPMPKRKRGRPLKANGVQKSIKQQQQVSAKRGRPPAVCNFLQQSNLTDSTNQNTNTISSSIQQQPPTFISNTIQIKQEPMY